MFCLRDAAIKLMDDQEFVIEFSGEAECPLKVYDFVTPGTVLFIGKVSEVLQSINLSRELAIGPRDVKDFVLKTDGEIIDKGDMIAKRKISMGMLERIVKVKFDGRLSFERIASGIVDIMSPFSDDEIKAGVSGRVKRIFPADSYKRQIMVSVRGFVSCPFVCGGQNASGKIHFIKEGDSIYVPADIDKECKGKIVVAGRKLTVKLYNALVESGAAGVIVGGMHADEYRVIEEKAIPIFISEGFGVIPINKVFFDILNEYRESSACINCDQNKLIIHPQSGVSDYESKKWENFEQVSVGNVKIGDIVQVWDMPYWGYSGEVVNVFDEEDLIQIEFKSKQKLVASSDSVVVIG